GPGKIKMDRPSLMAIYRIFFSVATSTVKINGLSFIEDIINL
ncbi:hypothetical protein EDD79_10811, partial [Serpentinicella alkaliphila]